MADLQDFTLFPYLPFELREMVWGFAVRPDVPSVHWLSSQQLESPSSPRLQPDDDTEEGAITHWNPNTMSTYLIDWGMWTACTESRKAIQRELGRRGHYNRASPAIERLVGCRVTFSPSEDILILSPKDEPLRFGVDQMIRCPDIAPKNVIFPSDQTDHSCASPSTMHRDWYRRWLRELWRFQYSQLWAVIDAKYAQVKPGGKVFYANGCRYTEVDFSPVVPVSFCRGPTTNHRLCQHPCCYGMVLSCFARWQLYSLDFGFLVYECS